MYLRIILLLFWSRSASGCVLTVHPFSSQLRHSAMLKLLWTSRDNISMKLSLAGLRSSLEPISDMLSEQYSDRLYSASPLAQQSVEVVQVEQWVEVASNSAGRVALERAGERVAPCEAYLPAARPSLTVPRSMGLLMTAW